jgi:CheY-like chemotaxis protein
MKDKFSIVLIDDDSDEHLFFKEALKSLKHNVDFKTLDNGEALMTVLTDGAEIPDIVFLDINMPGLSGFEVLTSIRTNEKFNKMRVVIYSTSNNINDIQKAYSLNADLYFVKEKSIDELAKKLDKILKLVQANEPLPMSEYQSHDL